MNTVLGSMLGLKVRLQHVPFSCCMTSTCHVARMHCVKWEVENCDISCTSWFNQDHLISRVQRVAAVVSMNWCRGCLTWTGNVDLSISQEEQCLLNQLTRRLGSQPKGALYRNPSEVIDSKFEVIWGQVCISIMSAYTRDLHNKLEYAT